MEDRPVMNLTVAVFGSVVAAFCVYWFWRTVWFFRNPTRTPPAGEGIVSPADGTVVYAQVLRPHEDVITIKQGLSATLNDIVREDLHAPKVLIGIFMSPFNVHYNRVPLSGEVQFIRHSPAVERNVHMTSMHRRILLKRFPLYRHSRHIVQNERTVTKIRGTYRDRTVSCYVVQIAGGSVCGIDSYVEPGQAVKRGDVFGMIRIGSQVDLLVTLVEGMEIRVRPGQKVRAGETLVIH